MSYSLERILGVLACILLVFVLGLFTLNLQAGILPWIMYFIFICFMFLLITKKIEI